MNIRDRQSLKKEAENRLAQAVYDPAKLILVHSGISAGVLLLLTVINFVLDNQMESAVGLRGLDTRTMLATIQSALEMVSTIALPFWNMGYLFAVMGWMHRDKVTLPTLFGGFRHFGPVLRLHLVKYMLFAGLAVLCFYPSMIVFMLTPLADPMIAALEPVVESSSVADMELLMANPAVTQALEEATTPMLMVFCIVFLFAAAPMFYRLRMGEFALIDNPRAGAFAALRKSRQIMKGNLFAMLRLDISFWWFYILELLLAAVCYGDIILPMLGIALPFSTTAAFFVFYVLNLVGQVALYWWKKNWIMTTYAVAYEALDSAAVAVTPAAPVAQEQIWEKE